jgi:hypothetical protein
MDRKDLFNYERNRFMKRTVMLAMGFVLSGLMVAAAQGGQNNGSGTRQKDALRSVQSGTSVQAAPRKGLSRRNKAVMEQSEASQMRRKLIQSGDTGTMPK